MDDPQNPFRRIPSHSFDFLKDLEHLEYDESLDPNCKGVPSSRTLSTEETGNESFRSFGHSSMDMEIFDQATFVIDTQNYGPPVPVLPPLPPLPPPPPPSYQYHHHHHHVVHNQARMHHHHHSYSAAWCPPFAMTYTGNDQEPPLYGSYPLVEVDDEDPQRQRTESQEFDPLVHLPIQEIKDSPPPTPPTSKAKTLRQKRNRSNSRNGRRNRNRERRMKKHDPVDDLRMEDLHVSPSISPNVKRGKISLSLDEPPIQYRCKDTAPRKRLHDIGCIPDPPLGTSPSAERKAVKSKPNSPSTKLLHHRKSKRKHAPSSQSDGAESLSLRDLDSLPSLPTSKDKKGSKEKKRERRKDPEKKEYIEEITEMDILLGRGGGTNNHPGNKAYRKHILKLQKDYKGLSTEEKTEMSKSVLVWVKMRGGRFLKQDKKEDGGRFYIVTESTARQKVSQALREDHTLEGRKEKKSRLSVNKNLETRSH